MGLMLVWSYGRIVRSISESRPKYSSDVGKQQQQMRAMASKVDDFSRKRKSDERTNNNVEAVQIARQRGLPSDNRVVETKEERMKRTSKLLDPLNSLTANDRIRDLSNIVLSARDGAVPWPSYLTPHQGSTKSSPENAASCIVTGYFRVKSKHAANTYDTWMKNMLSMRDCMVIFCDADIVETILAYRGNNTLTSVIAVELKDLPISTYYYPTATETSATVFWEHQLKIDPEKRIHKGYEVFWIWLSKSWFVTTAALLQDQLFGSLTGIEIWMWADIGSFRDGMYRNTRLVQNTNIFPDAATVLWMAHRTPNPPADAFWNKKLDGAEKRHFYQSGSHAVAASVAAWTTFHTQFVDTLDQYAAKGLFVGEDQCVIQSTCLLHPESCAYVPFDQVPDNKYFGLRHVLHFGPNGGKSNKRQNPFQLWRPPTTVTTNR